ncbi:hypothetical protein TNCV_2536321 [Trichonephila clavipes]|nr:hypothetical protein TNCV_2536321 [Trichonephila clavipes]
MLTTRWFNQDCLSFRPTSLFIGAAETSRNITTRVIERYFSEPLLKFLKESRGSELTNLVVKVTKVANLVAKNDVNLALPPRFRQALIESSL